MASCLLFLQGIYLGLISDGSPISTVGDDKKGEPVLVHVRPSRYNFPAQSLPIETTMADIRHEDPILTEMVTRLRAVFEPERIYLFGSHARGDAKPESDYDLLMVLPSSPLPRYRREQVAFRALDGMGISKDILVLTRAEFDRQRNAL